MMFTFRLLMLVIVILGGIGTIADSDKNKFLLLFAVAGAMFLCSFVGGVR